MNDSAAQRIDKWLWYARFFKTRTLAARFVAAGKVRHEVNGEAARIQKSSHLVRPNDILTFPLRRMIMSVRVLDVGQRRGPAAEAELLYEDLSPPAPKATKLSPPERQRAAGQGRPTKKERRALSRFTGNAD